MLTLNDYLKPEISEFIADFRQFCSCVPSTMSDEEIWKSGLFSAFIYTSKVLRWSDSSCNSFLVDERYYKATVDIDCCFSGIKLPHNQISSITEVSLYKITSCSEGKYTFVSPTWGSISETLKLCKDDIVTDDANNDYKLSELIDCCKCKKCCPESWILEVKYLAGYSEIPDCILPFMCELYAYMQLMNNKCSDKCKNVENISYNAVLKQYSVGDRDWQWEVPNNIYVNYMDQFISSGLFSSIFHISNKSPEIFTIGSIC